MRISKRIEAWLKDLKEPERTQALQNLNPIFKDDHADSLWEALSMAFNWQKSPQRWEYWNNIATKIIKEEYHGTERID